MIARPCSVLLDAQGVAALAARTRQMHVWLTAVEATRSELFVSAATLAEATDGSARDANTRRVIATHATTCPVDEAIGYDAGRLRARAAGGRKKPRDLTVDALVAATARTLVRPVIVLTSDVEDLRALLADEPGIRVHRID